MNVGPAAPRRRLCAALGAAGLWPGASIAQTRKARVAFLGGAPPDAVIQRTIVDPFRNGLRELGYVEGQTLLIDYRWSEGRNERLPALVGELLAANPDVIVTVAPRPALAAQAATKTVPIVAAAVDNPVLMGLAQSMARPGGNITGVSSFGIELLARRLQLLKDLVPQGRRFAVLENPASANVAPELPAFEKRLGVAIVAVPIRAPEDFDAAFARFERERIEGVVVLGDPMIYLHRLRLGQMMLAAKLPSVWGGGPYLEGGGVASFQSSFPEIFARAAVLVHQILQGAKPAEMPFEQATRLDLVLNLRAARALGLKLPQSLLVSATEVIE